VLYNSVKEEIKRNNVKIDHLQMIKILIEDGEITH
jgi:hypothetical protein